MTTFFDNLDLTTLTKAGLVRMLCDRLGLSQRDARDMVEQMFGLIAGQLEQGHEVKLSGFGTFVTLVRKERIGRNVRTGVTVPIKRRRGVRFSAGGKLRQKLLARDAGQ
jgi:integration host factor subunit alpha